MFPPTYKLWLLVTKCCCVTFVSLFINLRHPRDFVKSFKTSAVSFHIAHIPKGNLVLLCTNVFLWHIGIFSLPAEGLFSCSRLRGTQGSPPGHQGASFGPWPSRGTRSGSSKWQVPTGSDSEHVEPHPGPCKPTYYRLKECPTAHVISGILNVVNVVRHYLVMERLK